MQEGLVLHDINQYSEDYTPCSTDRFAIHRSITRHRAEIGVIEAKIAFIKAELDAAVERRDQVQASCQVAESLVAPIRAVPVDVLQRIFVHCIPCIPDSSRAVNQDFDAFLQGKTHPDQIRATIVSVSRHWRKAAISSPSFWSTVILSSRHSFRHYYLEPLLSRSKELRLDVYMRPQVSLSHPSDFFTSWREFKSVVNLISSHMVRIRILVVDTRSSGVQALFREIFSVGARTDMLNLQTFGAVESTVGMGYNMHSPSEMSHGTIHAPNLSTLILSPSSITFLDTFTPLSLTSLERLTVCTLYWCFPPNFDRLSLCQNLKYLCWRDIGGVCRPHTMPRSFLLPSLKELVLVSINPGAMIPFLRILDAPGLESLDFRTTGGSSHPSIPHPNGADAVITFLPRVPHIQRLSLTSMSWLGYSVNEATRYLTVLTTITVTDCCLDATFFDTFPVISQYVPATQALTLYVNPTQFTVKRPDNPPLNRPVVGLKAITAKVGR